MADFASEELCPNCGRNPNVIFLFGIEFRPTKRPTRIIDGVSWPCCCNCGHVLVRKPRVKDGLGMS